MRRSVVLTVVGGWALTVAAPAEAGCDDYPCDVVRNPSFLRDYYEKVPPLPPCGLSEYPSSIAALSDEDGEVTAAFEEGRLWLVATRSGTTVWKVAVGTGDDSVAMARIGDTIYAAVWNPGTTGGALHAVRWSDGHAWWRSSLPAVWVQLPAEGGTRTVSLAVSNGQLEVLAMEPGGCAVDVIDPTKGRISRRVQKN